MLKTSLKQIWSLNSTPQVIKLFGKCCKNYIFETELETTDYRFDLSLCVLKEEIDSLLLYWKQNDLRAIFEKDTDWKNIYRFCSEWEDRDSILSKHIPDIWFEFDDHELKRLFPRPCLFFSPRHSNRSTIPDTTQNIFRLYEQYHEKSLDYSKIDAPFALFYKYIKYLANRSNRRLSEYDFYWPTGICIPGMRSIFMAWNGNMYPCEKLYDYEDMCIGHIDKGFFIDQIVEYIEEYASLTLPYCRDCWSYRLCGYCFLNARVNNSFDMKSRLEYCAALRKTMLEHLKLYITINAKNERAFDYLKEEGDGKAFFVDQMLDD